MDSNRAAFRQRRRRRFRVRKPIHGHAERPRLSVFRSHKHIRCQIIDDVAGKTLVSVGSADADLRAEVGYGGNKKAAEAIGRKLAEKAIAAGITQVSFDRGSYKYHGRVASLAESARAAGLNF